MHAFQALVAVNPSPMNRRVRLFPELERSVDKIRECALPRDRGEVLKPLIAYVQQKLNTGQEAHLVFICTHNSRRSQFAQIWAHTAAAVHGIPIQTSSGGTEVTAFHENAVRSLIRSGFEVVTDGSSINPVYLVRHSPHAEPLRMYSKSYDDPANASDKFVAVMTCAHADENCPFIPGAEQRIPIRYDDPKVFDDSPEAGLHYDACSLQIASDMFYIFSKINTSS